MYVQHSSAHDVNEMVAHEMTSNATNGCVLSDFISGVVTGVTLALQILFVVFPTVIGVGSVEFAPADSLEVGAAIGLIARLRACQRQNG
jgi:Mg/Co/Ni transporter MgtE